MIRPRLFDQVPGVVAGFTTRAFVGLDEDVSTARARLAESAGFGLTASAGQVHGSHVEVVRGARHVADCDGLVTDQPDLLLTVVSADCALLLIADPEANVLGACHAGWRGAVGEITSKTVRAMVDLGAVPSRMSAYVSPCIGTDAFEVGDEVAEQFASSAVIRRPEWPRPHVDLKAELGRQLLEAGLPEGSIEIDPSCTAADTDRFYSYRAEGGTSGRMFGFIGRNAPHSIAKNGL